jgi:CHASE2 domain-containing sensor protein
MTAWQKSVIGVLVLMALMRSLGVTDSLNRWLTDAHWQFRASFKPTPFPNDILIVAIDDKSLRKLGRLRYWSRK